MKMIRKSLKRFSAIIVLLCIIFSIFTVYAEETTHQKIYDFAELLTTEEIETLESLSNKYSPKREVDIIVLTTKDTQGKDVVSYMEDFYDEKGLGYDKPYGNTAILTIDMEHRELYVAGFYKGEEYLDDSRCDLIREKITPALSAGNYYKAVDSFIELSYRYMGIKPGVNPESMLFQLWFQALISVIVAGFIVMLMSRNSGGGKYTVEERTYLVANNSGITDRKDIFIRTDISTQLRPSNDSNISASSRPKPSSSGGGVTKAGHSHSGSRGSF